MIDRDPLRAFVSHCLQACDDIDISSSKQSRQVLFLSLTIYAITIFKKVVVLLVFTGLMITWVQLLLTWRPSLFLNLKRVLGKSGTESNFTFLLKFVCYDWVVGDRESWKQFPSKCKKKTEVFAGSPHFHQVKKIVSLWKHRFFYCLATISSNVISTSSLASDHSNLIEHSIAPSPLSLKRPFSRTLELSFRDTTRANNN